MKRHAQIGQHTVGAVHAVVAEKVRDISEIGVYDGETLVGHGTLHGIAVLIEAVEVTSERGVETLHDGTRMATAAVGYVDVGASGLYIKGFD